MPDLFRDHNISYTAMVVSYLPADRARVHEAFAEVERMYNEFIKA